MTGMFIRGRQREEEEARPGGQRPYAKEHLEPPEVTTRHAFCLRASQCHPINTIIADFWPPELRESISVILSHPVGSNLLQQSPETEEETGPDPRQDDLVERYLLGPGDVESDA